MTITLLPDTELPDTEAQTRHIVMHGITWKTYQALLKDLGDGRSSRLAYDQGVLEIIMPSDLHERFNRLLALLITTLVEELNLKVRNYGSTTLDREDLGKGVEPDSCFYIQNVDRILGKRLNIATDPPPDLAVEVDITSSSRRRFGIYLQLQVPEVWQYTKRKGVTIYQLLDGEYVECAFSPTFPMISGAVLMQFIRLAEDEDDISVIRALRQWLKGEAESGL
jgi:Uma2 family endonuclease